MRLSEAIRLGAMNKPQVFGALIRDGGTCALGAAYDAVGLLIGENADVPCLGAEMFPLLNTASDCPDCYFVRNEFTGFVITHLNDLHQWTRERIADWVETLEPKADIEAPPPPVPVEVGVRS